MAVCITGATGFIGGKFAEQHLKLGNEVRYLTRRHNKPIIGAKAFIEDLNSTVDQLTPFLNTAETFYHCKGELKNEESIHNTNVQGALNQLQVIKQCANRCNDAPKLL
jgi:nucleoside-diphosphate-sugar epimerase